MDPVLETTPKSDLEALRQKIFEAKPTAELLEKHEKIINEFIDNPKKFAPNLDPELIAPKIKLIPGEKVKVISTDPSSHSGLFGPETTVNSEPSYIMKRLYKSPFYKENLDITRKKLEDIRRIISKANNNQIVVFGHELNPQNTNYCLNDSGDHLDAFVKLTSNQQKYRVAKVVGWTGLCFGVAVKEYARAQMYKVYGVPLAAIPKDIYTFVAGSTISFFFGEFILNNFSPAPARLVGWSCKYLGGLVYYLPATVVDQLILGPIEEKVAKLRLPVNITKESGLTEFKSTGADATRLKKLVDFIYKKFFKE